MRRLKNLTGQETVLLFGTQAEDIAPVQAILTSAGIPTVFCKTIEELHTKMTDADVAIITQDAVLADKDHLIYKVIGAEPFWSEFPIIVLVDAEGEMRDMVEALEAIGNMKLVEQPVRDTELVRAVTAALRDRKRQYAIRDQVVQIEKNTDLLQASEQRYELAVHGMNDGLWDHNLETGESFYSLRYKEMLGYSDEELAGTYKAAYALIHPDDIAPAQKRLDEATASGEQLYENEFRMRHKDGNYRWVRSRASFTHNPGGKPIRLTGLHTDITEQRALEEKLKRSQEVFRTMADSMPALVWMAGLDQRCFYFNKAWLDFTGRRQEQEEGNGWTQGIHPDDAAHRLDVYVTAFAKRESFEMIYRLRRYDGEYRYILNRGEPHYNLEGEFAGYTGACIDVHDKMEVEELLRDSEERFRQMVDSIPQLSWMANENGEIFWYNQRWFDFTHTDPDTMQREGWKAVIHPDYAKGVIKRFNQAIELGLAWEDTFPIRSKDGEYRWFLSRAFPIADTKVARWFGTHTDITQQMEREKQLQISEERWKILTEAMPQLVWIDRGSDSKCLYLSKQWETYTGIPVEELLTYDWLPCFHDDDREPTFAAWNKAVSEKSVYDIEFRIRRHDGVMRWFKTRGVPVMNAADDSEMWYGTCTDIQDLVDAREKSAEANRAKTDFLANMSHEIRTPMNAVVGLSSILAMTKPLTQKQTECIQTLQLSADSLLALINNLLDIEKIEARSIELEEIAFSVYDLTQDVTNVISVSAKEKSISFEMSSSCEYLKSRVYLGDPTRLRQVLMNLCSNAIKFTEKGGVSMEISCHPHADKLYETIHIAVRDTGIGIAANKRDDIFHKFVQGDSSINRKYGGTGLGLAITKTLAEIMGGTITVESEKGVGSTFTIAIPLRIANVAECAEHHAVIKKEEKMPIADIVRPRVLLVEDYPANILVATTFLEMFGYDCDVANNGVEAIDKIKKNQYVVVLMDVQMHEMNGLDATRHIRAHEKEKNLHRIPIIGMTAHALAGDREVCIEAGMDDYISKPFNADELQHKLEVALESSSVSG